MPLMISIVNIVSGNDLAITLGTAITQPLSEPKSIKIYVAIWRH